jgi:hypothetical protein
MNSTVPQSDSIVRDHTRAAILALTLALLAVVSYVLIRRIEADNPRRSYLERQWASVAEGVPGSAVVALLGPPDEERDVRDFVPAEDAPTGAAADSPSAPQSFYTCVHERVWYAAPAERAGDVYLICEDPQGIVRRKSHGRAFNLRSY